MANFLTVGRILAIAPFIALFMTNAAWNLKAALGIFVLAAITDFLDGRIARARGEVSPLGATLDPLADKLLITAALVMLIRNGVIHGPHTVAAIIIILRELLISGLREATAQQNASLPVTTLAKWKTAAQSVACALLLAAAPTGIIGVELAPFALGTLWLAAILTFWTGAGYSLRAVQLLRGKGQ